MNCQKRGQGGRRPEPAVLGSRLISASGLLGELAQIHASPSLSFLICHVRLVALSKAPLGLTFWNDQLLSLLQL